MPDLGEEPTNQDPDTPLGEEPTNQDPDTPSAANELVGEMETVYQKLMDGQPIEDLCKSSVVEKTKEILKTETDALSNSRTAKLWLQYMKMRAILRCFLRGERSGNWPLHLQAILEMLVFFAASGHYNYLKSCYIYLQEMINLENSHPDVYYHFCNGLHVI